MIARGEVRWAELGPARGSRPAKRRPVLVVSADSYNASRLATVLVAVLTSNTGLTTMPGNVFVSADHTGLPRDSVVNVTALVTLNKTDLGDVAGAVPAAVLEDVDRGLRQVLDL